jgi:hypothetical protein
MKGKIKRVDISTLDVSALAKAAAATAERQEVRPPASERRAQEKAARAAKRLELITAIAPAVKTMRSKNMIWKEIAAALAPVLQGVALTVRELRMASGETEAAEKPRRGRPAKATA